MKIEWYKLTARRGDKDLEVPVAVRPTSEAVMYPCRTPLDLFYTVADRQQTTPVGFEATGIFRSVSTNGTL